MGARVLVVEDEEALRELLEYHLGKAGFEVELAADLAAAEARYRESRALVLDWMLPDGSGIDWLLELRRRPEGVRLPVLVLSARATEMDKVTGLGSGADDYLVKPFSVAELLARLRALLRRAEPDEVRRVGELVIDVTCSRATLAGEPLELTRREFDLLAFLSAYPGRVFSRDELLSRVWGEAFWGGERTVDQHVAQLRARIGAAHIETVRGRGYRLADDA